ncbi:O-antigen ligase family protein [Priestia megaterium]|uniref:O-antigen ligase family protein n=1 Tax=Priestia megaterium TaxID=1404 RepID=UPI00234F69FF|nr:O-antigen ligase family protein [Priestia megaterium]MDC7783893.1 O-antigen ligase family protein [Priestia megaterium]
MSSNILYNNENGNNNSDGFKSTIFSTKTFLIDLIICGSFILISEILNNSSVYYILLLYIVLKTIVNSPQYSFNIILLLIPNLGVVFIPGIPAPLVNLIISISVIKMATQYKGKHMGFILLTLVFILYEWAHAFGYDLSTTFSLVSWTFSILYIFLFIGQKLEYNHATAIKYFIGGICISTIYGIYAGFLKHGSISTFSRLSMSDRFSGGAGDANYYSIYILIGIFSMVSLVNKQNKLLHKILLMVIFISLTFFGFTSLSRMFIIVFSFSMIVYLLRALLSYQRYSRHRRFLIGLIALAASSSMLYLNTIINNITLIFSRFTTSGDLSSLTSNRDVILEHYIDFLLSHPVQMLFGVGIQKYYLRTGPDTNVYAHNIVMELLVSWGIIGFILFLSFIISLFFMAKYNSEKSKAGVIVWLPFLCMFIGYMSINGIEVESFYILIIYVIKNIYAKIE